MVRSRCELCAFYDRPLFAPPCNACRLMPIGADCFIERDDSFEEMRYTLQRTNINNIGCCRCITIDDYSSHFGECILNAT